MSYTGGNGGLVIAVADDMGMHSSQNEQDSRRYAIAAKVPMLEPSDSEECRGFAAAAFELSETFDTPVLLRTSTRVAHAQSAVTLRERAEVGARPYQKSPQKYVMMPANARFRRVAIEERAVKLAKYAESAPFNQILPGPSKLGIISAGVVYSYAREALGDNASYLSWAWSRLANRHSQNGKTAGGGRGA